MSFLLSEDAALRDLLTGMTVSDDKNPARKVGVWFGQPDIEMQQQSYPYITIDLIDVREATNRAMRNKIELTYTPDGAPARVDGRGYTVDYPIPYDLFYQVTTYARSPRHDRQIIHQIMQTRLGGRMHTLYIPADDTQRSMFLTGSQKRDKTEANRRLFSNAYTVQVFSELLTTQIEQVMKVTHINQTLLNIHSI